MLGRRVIKHYDVDKNTQTMMSLMNAIRQGDLQSVIQVCEQGADLEAKDENGNNALLLSCRLGHANILEYVIESGCKLNITDAHGNSPLTIAAKAGNTQCVRVLLNKDSDIDLVSGNKNDGCTAVSFAGMYGHLNTLQILLQATQCGEFKPSQQAMALTRVAANGHTGCLTALLDSGMFDVDVRDWHGETALHWGAAYGQFNSVMILLKAHGNSNIHNNYGRNALSKAISCTATGCAKLLFAAGTNTTDLDTGSLQNILKELGDDTSGGILLKCLCRNIIRLQLVMKYNSGNGSNNFLCTVGQLPLPKQLQNFLLYNIDDTEIPHDAMATGISTFRIGQELPGKLFERPSVQNWVTHRDAIWYVDSEREAIWFTDSNIEKPNTLPVYYPV